MTSYFAEPPPNPYPTPEPIPYEPDHPDNPDMGPSDSSPPGPPLITIEEALAQAEPEVQAEPVEPEMVTAYKVKMGDNIYAQTPEQTEAINHFIETGE